MTKRLRRVLLIVVAAFCAGQLAAYPLDGYEETGIRRVEWARMAHLGLAKEIAAYEEGVRADFSPRERSCRPLP